ncbi:hypothetical protein BDW22DRAFT_1352085 [Trametopsis cervina]|nr:hypothetical protein BDW22DRAFT_1352085 [Trametopsis cervina]
MSSDWEHSSYSLDGYLPMELICSIFEYLHCSDLVVCRQLCTTIKQIIDTSVVLQYKIQLHLTGMADNPAHHLSVVEKLALLQQYHAQWYSLPVNLKRVMLFDRIHLDSGAEKHVIRGILGIGPSLEGDFYFAQLPSRIRGIPLKSWVLRLPEHSGAFAMDPQQDLLIIVKKPSAPEESVSFRVLQLSTGSEHPLASNPPLPLIAGLGREWLKMRISGPYLCVRSVEYDWITAIWNWRSGSCIHTESHTASFAWVGPTHLLLGVFGRSTASPIDPPKLVLMDLSQPQRERRQWEFHLPMILCKREDFGELFDFDIHCEPATSQDRTGMGFSDPPFHVAEKDRLVALTSDESKVRMFFLASRLFDIVRNTANVTTEAIVVPWKEWGPGHMHVDYDYSPYHGYMVYGTRYVACWSNRSDILDFNKYHAWYKMQACSGEEEDDRTLVRAYSQTHWLTMTEDVDATDEDIAELCLDVTDTDGQRKHVFEETISLGGLRTGFSGSMFSEDAICVSRGR